MTGDATHDFVVDFGLDLVTKRVRWSCIPIGRIVSERYFSYVSGMEQGGAGGHTCTDGKGRFGTTV